MNNIVSLPANLASNNGRICYESDVPMGRGNPYRKGSQRHADFISGYLSAQAVASARHLNRWPKGEQIIKEQAHYGKTS